jgi:hypothetical protein
MPLILPGNVASATAGAYEVANSCRFNKADVAYLHKTMGAGNRKTFTYSIWVKRALLGVNQYFTPTQADSANANAGGGSFDSNDLLDVWDYNAPGISAQMKTNRKFRDVGAWMHVVITADTTDSTENNRFRMYINGVDERTVGGYATDVMPAEDYEFNMNQDGEEFYIGTYFTSSAGSSQYGGYMAEVCFIDGTAYAASDFGEFNEDSPTIWQPKDVSGLTFGTNGFYLDFEDSANLGNDANGGTDLTEVNLDATDQAVDSPTNNFATWNTLIRNMSTYAYSEGNLQVNTSSSHEAAYGSAFSNFGMTAGKWYAEFKCTSNADTVFIGVSSNLEDDILGSSDSAYTFSYKGNGWAYYGSDGKVQHTDSDTWLTYGSSLSDNDIVGVALDLDNLELYFSVNGTWQNSGDPTSGSTKTGGVVNGGAKALNGSGSTGTWYFCASDNSQSTVCTVQANFGSPINTISSGNSDDNGYGNFEYDVPTGYLALCTKNLGSDGG